MPSAHMSLFFRLWTLHEPRANIPHLAQLGLVDAFKQEQPVRQLDAPENDPTTTPATLGDKTLFKNAWQEYSFH